MDELARIDRQPQLRRRTGLISVAALAVLGLVLAMLWLGAR